MAETDARNVFLLNELQNPGDLADRLPGEREPQPDFLAGVTAVPPAPPPALAAPAPTAPKGGMFARNRHAAAATGVADRTAPPATVPPPPSGFPLSVAARTAARRLQESKQTIPHFYLQMTAAAEPMLARRAAALPQKLSWDAFFVYALAQALITFPKLGYRWDDGQLLLPEGDSIGVAVDLDDDLFVVSVPDASAKTPEQISEHIRTAVDALRRHDPEARRLTHNRMTVTNLGMTGVDAFAAIINPPEAAVLAVGKIGPAVVAENGLPVVRQRVTLTLSVDHRVANGRYAAGFLSHVVAALESLDQNEP
jgi:pyruvate dehydrogenase E2 component (dihydrolipoamide acetyltransferase)